MAPVQAFSSTPSPVQSMTSLVQQEIPLGEYFFRRIKSLGVSSCFTVPGDYNLFFLDHSYNVPGMTLRNCCNELNTAYAADGYSRASNKLGVAITTFGVGELSAMNGISGAMAESVPVLHVVGTTPRSVKAKRDNHTHHLITPIDTLQSSNHHIYEKMAESVSCCVESIKDLENAPLQIDHVLREILVNKRPGYLYVPSDLANGLVDSSRLVDVSGESFYLFEDKTPSVTSEVVEKILSRLYSSENPSIVGDVLIDRFQLTSTLREFVKKTQFNNYCTPMSKSILDESETSFVGDYWGKESNPLVIDLISASDLVLHFGEYHNEINSGHYSLYSGMDPESIISIGARYVKIGSQLYENLDIVPVVTKLVSLLDQSLIPKVEAVSPATIAKIHDVVETSHNNDISQAYLTQKLQSFLRPGDYLVCETGSFMFTIPDVKLPQGARFFGQNFYLSIGYALPATLGIGCAMKDAGLPNRLVLFEGDGAAQMTIQEFSNYMLQDIKPTIFLLNNSGYTVERIINGPELSYNDIQPDWDWTNIFRTFGDVNNSRSVGFKATSKIALSKMMQTFSEEETNDKIKIVEVILDKFDVPWRFHFMTNASKS